MVLYNSYDSGQTAVLFLHKMVDRPTDQREIINVIYSLMCWGIFSYALYAMLTKRPRMWTLDYKIVGIVWPIKKFHLDFKEKNNSVPVFKS